MAINEIIRLGKNFIEELESRAREFDFKSYEHDLVLRDIADVEAIMLRIESSLHIPGVFSKLDYREDINYYWNLLERETDDDKRLEIVKCIDKDVKNTLLWAKKLSWLGDWDLNYDGRHTLMSIVFVPAPEIREFNVPRYYFHKGENITNKNYKMEIRSTESNFTKSHRIAFSEDWENVEFNIERGESWMTFRGNSFTWNRANFAGTLNGRPFFAERTSDFFGKNHVVYYSAGY